MLHLLDRPRARVFLRRDRFNRFVTALAYMPKDRFNSDLREAGRRAIAQAYGGEVESFYPQLGEGQLARVLFVIGEIDKTRPDPDPLQLDPEIAALTRTWDDALRRCADALGAVRARRARRGGRPLRGCVHGGLSRTLSGRRKR